MGEMIVVECDYGDGECLERYEGFSMHADRWFRSRMLIKNGWTVVDDKHYCPKHKRKENENDGGS